MVAWGRSGSNSVGTPSTRAQEPISHPQPTILKYCLVYPSSWLLLFFCCLQLAWKLTCLKGHTPQNPVLKCLPIKPLTLTFFVAFSVIFMIFTMVCFQSLKNRYCHQIHNCCLSSWTNHEYYIIILRLILGNRVK